MVGLGRQAVKIGSRGIREVIRLDQGAAEEQRIGVRKGMEAALGGNQLVGAGRDRGEPLSTRQAMQDQAGVVGRTAEDRHRLFNRNGGLLLPFEVKD